ncbi:MAG: histidine kinase [Saprospiraceae bacterium]|nr:histidine kinase [Saprospiraceae bacterium]
MSKNAFLTILRFCCLLGAGHLAAQQPDMVFHNLTEKEGLSYNIVNAFLKDRDGFLWVGTYSGLNRFDGAHFFVFKQNNDSTSLVHNSVHALCEDQSGNIWGGTDEGIFCYLKKQNRFIPYKKTAQGKIAGAHSILCDRNGTVWASGLPGLLRFDPAKNTFEVLHHVPSDSFSISNNRIHKNGLLEDPAGRGIWIATQAGLNFYDRQSRRFYNARNQTGNPLYSASPLSALAPSSEGHFWAMENTSKSILRIDARQQRIVQTVPTAQLAPNAYGATLFEDSRHRLWLSSWSYEILAIDYQQGNRIQKIKHSDTDESSIAGDFFWAAREDEEGTIWLGTVGGISTYNPAHSFYKVHRLAEKIPELRANFAIRGLIENPRDHSWWIIVVNNRVLHYFPQSEEYELLDLKTARPNARGERPAPLVSIQFLGDKTLFNTAAGSWQWSAKEPQIKAFTGLPAPWQDFRIRALGYETDSICWLNGQTQVLRWNLNTQAIESFAMGNDTAGMVYPTNLWGLVAKPGLDVWMHSMPYAIVRVDRRNKRLERVLLDNHGRTKMLGGFSDIDVDARGRVWMACKGQGLYSYDPGRDSTTVWRESDGLVFDHIMATTVDPLGQLWTAGYNKIAVFNPKTQNFYNFTLPLSTSNYGYVNYSTLLHSGHVTTTIMGDVVEFFPDKIATPPLTRQPVISLLRISGQDKILNGETSVLLEPDENFITIKFGMLTDQQAFPCEFDYRLDGVNDQWVSAGNSTEAVYTDLEPGTYAFHLIAKSKNKSWTTPEKTLTIVIRAPFYKTWWFRLLALSSLAFGLYALYRYRFTQKERMMQLESKAQALEKEKALVMYEHLKQHLNPHFLFNSLTSLGSLIRIDQAQAGDFLDKMSKVYRYILKNRDNEAVPLGEELKFVKLYIGLQQTRFEQGLVVNISIDDEYFHRKVAPVTLQNLVENAIKHNIADVDTPLVIDLFIEDDYLTVRNNLHRKNFVETSNKQGLANMASLYSYLSDRKMIVREDEHFFVVKIPLI